MESLLSMHRAVEATKRRGPRVPHKIYKINQKEHKVPMIYLDLYTKYT